jgi:hypothetical protein
MAGSTRLSRCQSVSASRGRASSITRSSAAAASGDARGAVSITSSAAANVSDVSSKRGVPGPRPGRVRQTAPAGMNASRPSHAKPTQPLVTRINPAPASSIDIV